MSHLPETAKAETERIVSAVVALACIAIPFFFGKREIVHVVITVLVIPLGCVWYGREIGSFVGMSEEDGEEQGKIAGALIMIVGWLVLFAGLIGLTLYTFWG